MNKIKVVNHQLLHSFLNSNSESQSRKTFRSKKLYKCPKDQLKAMIKKGVTLACLAPRKNRNSSCK